MVNYPAHQQESIIRSTRSLSLLGRRVLLRPLHLDDYGAWRDVRIRNTKWLTRWEPQPLAGRPDPVHDLKAFESRCHLRLREWRLGVSYGFGLFVDGSFCGEININTVQRGPVQGCNIGYWIDQKHAGNGYVPEGVVLLLQFAFEDLCLHRVEIAIIPRNDASLRVVDKLGLREEGLALRFLEINGVWEDHLRFAITAEEWNERCLELTQRWL